MKAYVIKNLESDMYLYNGFKLTNKVWEASKFITQKEASEHIEFSIGYFQIIKIDYNTKDIYFEHESKP